MKAHLTTESTVSLESIDRQIKELQEHKRRLIEEQMKNEESVFDVTEIVTTANQLFQQVLIDAGVGENEMLHLYSDQTGFRDHYEMISLQVKNSNDKVVLN